MVDAMSEFGVLEYFSSKVCCTNIFTLSPEREVRYSFWIGIRARIMALLAKSMVILLGDPTSERDGFVPSAYHKDFRLGILTV